MKKYIITGKTSQETAASMLNKPQNRREITEPLAKAFGAMKTPHVYLFDANDRLVYTGAIDDNAKSAKRVKKNYLMDALSSLGSGKNIATRKTKALGCSIKFN